MNDRKHVPYHRAPTRFAGDEVVESKYKEEERFLFIKSKLRFQDKKILDIGCNSGYFIFEALDHGAKSAVCYEGSTESQKIISGFIEKSDEKNVTLHKKYFDFEEAKFNDHYDITFLLNVVHHYGDDYGDRENDLTVAKHKMLQNINILSNYSEFMVFQMGFNWQGDINKPIFDKGTKAEMIRFVRQGVKDYWEVKAIGVAEVTDGITQYHDLNDMNIKRDDSIGEFRNRPLFILKSMK